MTSAETAVLQRVAVLGTGLIGTSIAMAAVRAGCHVVGWDADPETTARAGSHGGFETAGSLKEACRDAELVVVCAPIPEIAALAAAALGVAPAAVVTDAGSVKSRVVEDVAARVDGSHFPRFVGGHPMGGSERSGPDHASASIVDGIVWVVTPTPTSDEASIDALIAWVRRLGSHPVRMDPDQHDRLVAVVSHLPQVAATTLMGLAATEEANEPEILLLAAGGFRDLTRLAGSSPALWSEILLANREAIARAINLYVERLLWLRELVARERAADVEAAFAAAKAARLSLAAKPTVRAGIAILQIAIPDRPGALAELTGALADAGVNIEDLQIVHSPEGGRGAVHLTVAADSAAGALDLLGGRGFDPIRLA